MKRTRIYRIPAISFFCICILVSNIAVALSQEEAAVRVMAETEGRILDIKVSEESNQKMYLVKVITPDSRVIIVKVDADSGRILQ